MDTVFKALADPTRRDLLDQLFERDGQTLSDLEERAAMTRFGVMKHLRVLEDAGLVTTKRRGREKLHFLNPVPIGLVYERWVSRFAQPRVATLSELKTQLEERTMEQEATENETGKRPWTASGTEQVFEIYIKTTPEKLWEAIVDPDLRRQYNFGVGVSSEWTTGSRYEGAPDGGSGPIVVGENLEVDRPHRLVQSFDALWSDDVKAEPTSRVTWDIEQVGDSCRLTVTHDNLRDAANSELYGGWPMVLSGLKTLLETGEQLTTPGSLMYTQS